MIESARPLASGRMRSLLLTPADSTRGLAQALESAADAVLLDIAGPEGKERARRCAQEALQHARGGGQKMIVRVNALDSGEIDADLDAVATHAPFAIMLPRARGGDDVQHLSVKIAVREAQCGLPDGSIRILPASECAEGLFRMPGYRGCTTRLLAIAWGAEDLMANVGALAHHLPEGGWTPPFALARNLTLFGAAAAGTPAIDAPYLDMGDAAGLRRETEEARRDGFSGKLAVHPDQAAIINDVFGPPSAGL